MKKLLLPLLFLNVISCSSSKESKEAKKSKGNISKKEKHIFNKILIPTGTFFLGLIVFYSFNRIKKRQNIGDKKYKNLENKYLKLSHKYDLVKKTKHESNYKDLSKKYSKQTKELWDYTKELAKVKRKYKDPNIYYNKEKRRFQSKFEM